MELGKEQSWKSFEVRAGKSRYCHERRVKSILVRAQTVWEQWAWLSLKALLTTMVPLHGGPWVAWTMVEG